MNLNLNIKYQQDKTQSTETPAPPNHDPDTSGEVQKARMTQALRAFLHLLPPGEDC